MSVSFMKNGILHLQVFRFITGPHDGEEKSMTCHKIQCHALFFGNRLSSIKIHNMRDDFRASGCNRVFPGSKWACCGAGCMRKHSFISRINEIPLENFITNIFIAILLILF